MKILLSLLLIVPIFVIAQTNHDELGENNQQVQRNVFRILITEPVLPNYETNGILYFNYEHLISNTITGVAKLGLAVTSDRFGPDGTRRSSYYAYSALEARYYFSRNRRLRKQRATLNNTGPYLSTEFSYISNAMFSLNQPDVPVNTFYGSINSYLNLGYQKQFGKLYIGAYAGGLLLGKRFYDFDPKSAAFHGGINVGYVF